MHTLLCMLYMCMLAGCINHKHAHPDIDLERVPCMYIMYNTCVSRADLSLPS